MPVGRQGSLSFVVSLIAVVAMALAVATTGAAAGSGAGQGRADAGLGWVRLQVIPHGGAAPLTSAIDWQILTFGRDAGGRRQLVAEAKGPQPELALPEGFYLAQAQTRDALVKHTIEVAAGRSYSYTLDMNAGAVAVSAVLGRGGPSVRETVDWQVFKAGDTAFSKPVTTRRAADGRFLLRQGRYVILARQGQWRGRTNVEVRAGNERRLTVELN